MSLPVCIDYLNLTFPRGNVDQIIDEVSALVGAPPELVPGGIHGYAFRVEFKSYALVGYGGESQRGTVFVSLNGAGCSRIASFADVRAWGESLGARITRADVCADDFHSVALDVARARRGWREGAFTCSKRAPLARMLDDLGSGAGRTLYVGSRDSGKLCRVYEKGKSLGDRVSKWVRAEVEFLAKDRVIPWEILTEPVRFLAGAYPFFARLSMIAERIETVKLTAAMTLKAAIAWARSAVGRTVNVMLHEYSGDLGAVVMELRREGVPRRLRAFFTGPGGAVQAQAV